MDASSPSPSVPRVAIFLRNMLLAYRDSLIKSYLYRFLIFEAMQQNFQHTTFRISEGV